MMNTCGIQLEAGQGTTVVYEIDVDDIETILAIDNIGQALMIILEGNRVDNELFEGHVFFNHSAQNEEEAADTLQEFQSALHRWLDENEVDDI